MMIVVIALCILGLFFLYIPFPWAMGRSLRKMQKRKAIRQDQLFLTFDDGPGNRLTPRILSILNENGIKATFFLLGRNIAGRESLIKAIVKDGHAVASHSYSHFHAWKILPWRSISDIKKGWKAINAVLPDNNTKYAYRPPCGKLNLFSLFFLWWNKVPVIFWSIDSLDTWPQRQRSVEYAAQKIQEDRGGIVLFHDFDRAANLVDDYVLDSLKAAIAMGKKMNLKFVTIEQLLP